MTGTVLDTSSQMGFVGKALPSAPGIRIELAPALWG
jgi:hypothetical protein